LAADTPNRMEYRPWTSMSISLSGDNQKELSGYWEKLSLGATIIVPLAKAPGAIHLAYLVLWPVNSVTYRLCCTA